jgi:hypothetical protein
VSTISAWFITVLVLSFYGYISYDILYGSAGDPEIIAYLLLGVVALGVSGALIVRFRPDKMFSLLLTMAGVQGVAAIVMLIIESGSLGPTLLVNGLLIAGLLGAGLAFRNVAQTTEGGSIVDRRET